MAEPKPPTPPGSKPVRRRGVGRAILGLGKKRLLLILALIITAGTGYRRSITFVAIVTTDYSYNVSTDSSIRRILSADSLP